mmetsp:Transcript_15077/g.35920  ORF Transcript_15077/g.35920 Transcript_15077/m.35920 type:complete len:223 (+) Transcript_15077:457-1125(+)
MPPSTCDGTADSPADAAILRLMGLQAVAGTGGLVDACAAVGPRNTHPCNVGRRVHPSEIPERNQTPLIPVRMLSEEPSAALLSQDLMPQEGGRKGGGGGDVRGGNMVVECGQRLEQGVGGRGIAGARSCLSRLGGERNHSSPEVRGKANPVNLPPQRHSTVCWACELPRIDGSCPVPGQLPVPSVPPGPKPLATRQHDRVLFCQGGHFSSALPSRSHRSCCP